MIKLTYEGKRYRIRFARFERMITELSDIPNKVFLKTAQTLKRRITEARILDADNRTVAVGRSICNPIDNFSREIGRKRALTNAIKETRVDGFSPNTSPSTHNYIGKQFATEIWSAYLNRPRLKV